MKIKYGILLLVLLGLTACNTNNEAKAINKTLTEKETADILLREAAAEINKRLPVMVDEQTRLDSTYVMSGELRYNFSLVNVLADQLDAYKFMMNMQQQIKTPICKAEHMQLFLQQDYPIVYHYFDRQKSMFARIKIDKENC